MHLISLALISAAPLLAASPAPATKSSSTNQAMSPQAAAAEFVSAFNALDRDRFDPLFAEDVTLFFPSAPFEMRRVTGKAETLAWFGKFFDAVRKRSGKLNIQPADLHVQDYGDMAIITFHLGNGEDIGRRTLVLRKKAGAWKIVHLHASSHTVKKAPG